MKRFSLKGSISNILAIGIIFRIYKTMLGEKYLDKSIADVYQLGIQKSAKGRRNGKNGNDTRKTYAGNKRKG